MFLKITSTLGSACVMAVAVLLLFRIGPVRRLAGKEGLSSQLLLAAVFGILAIYGTTSAISMDGVRITVRNVAPLVAGFLGGPVAGLGAGLIGAIQRWIAGGPTALPCGLACLTAGALGWGLWVWEKQRQRPLSLLLLAAAALVETCIHMLWVTIFGQATAAGIAILPTIISTAIAVPLMVYFYRNLDQMK